MRYIFCEHEGKGLVIMAVRITSKTAKRYAKKNISEYPDIYVYIVDKKTEELLDKGLATNFFNI